MKSKMDYLIENAAETVNAIERPERTSINSALVAQTDSKTRLIKFINQIPADDTDGVMFYIAYEHIGLKYMEAKTYSPSELKEIVVEYFQQFRSGYNPRLEKILKSCKTYLHGRTPNE